MTQQTKISLLVLLTICEISSLIFTEYSVAVRTLIYTAAGICISIIPLLSGSEAANYSNQYSRYTYLLYIALILLISNWALNVFRAHIYSTPLDVRMGDMLLYIREMSERYLAHQHVYEPISDINGANVFAIYLPAFWLPYCTPLHLGVDLRWSNLIAFIGSVLLVGLIRRKQYNNTNLLLLIPLSLFVYLILRGAAYYLMFTQEALVLLYIATLSLALIYEYWIVAGTAAAACILSRYFIGVPLLAGLVWLYTRDKKAATKTLLATLLALIIILTVSRSWGDLVYFLRIPSLYVTLLSDDSSVEAFRHIYKMSVGFAYFFRADSMYIITNINLAVLVIVPVGYFLFAYRYLTDRRIGMVILCGTKLFLVLFLTTLSRPFGYVLYTSSLVSIMVIRGMLSRPKFD